MQSPIGGKANAPIHFLREGTHAGHAAMEQTALARDLMSPDVSVARYVEILATWVSAWAVLEDRIEASAFAPFVSALLPIRRAHLGHNDLQYWAEQGYPVRHISAISVDELRQLEPADSSSLLGVCYVARGASLGAQVIARHLLQTLPPGAAKGITFFAPAAAPALSWPQWSHALNIHLETPAAVAQAVVWANATFAALNRAFSCASFIACGPTIENA
jgi:heme oxygenase (biliverdin-IX-beta and delta-forming)